MKRVRLALALLPVVVFSALFLPYDAFYTYAGDLLVPSAWQQSHPGPYTINVALLVDEEWESRFGLDAQEQAIDVLRRADRMFEPANIHLRLASYGRWTSSDGSHTIKDLLAQVVGFYTHDPGDIVVAFTAQYRGQEGGISHRDRRYILVKHHPYRPDRDAFVLAHELGHALGLDHHDCPHRYCIMSGHEYDPGQHWCPDHLKLLRANGGLFQYIHDVGPQT